MRNRKRKIAVTRSIELVGFMREQGLIDEDTPIMGRVTPEDIAGAHVIGSLPMDLAAEADRITVVTLHIPAQVRCQLRGRALTPDEVKMYSRIDGTFRVERV